MTYEIEKLTEGAVVEFACLVGAPDQSPPYRVGVHVAIQSRTYRLDFLVGYVDGECTAWPAEDSGLDAVREWLRDAVLAVVGAASQELFLAAMAQVQVEPEETS